MRATYLIILVFFSGSLFAQAPGYMGKRFSIGYDLVASPAGFGSVNMVTLQPFQYRGINNQGEPLKLVSLQPKHSITVEYALSRRFALYAGYQFFNYAMPTDISNPDVVQEEFYKSKSSGYKFGCTISKRNYISPQGKYFAFEVQLLDNESFFYSKILDKEIATSKEKYLGFSYDVGRRRIYYDRLMVDISVGFGFSIRRNFETYDNGNTPISQYSNLIYQNCFNLFHFKGGVRYLLF